MVPSIDLYSALHGLLEQIPDGMVSTPHHLALALGDPSADKAVTQAFRIGDMKNFSKKIVQNPGPGAFVFSDFVSDEPLKRLAELQRKMSKKVIREDSFDEADKFAGVDAVYQGDDAFAACVVMDGGLGLLETASAFDHTRFPYFPGYLMFREAPIVETAAKIVSDFDVLFVNGHGIAHPRGCGLASCVGLDLDTPTIGVARRRLVGDVGNKRNHWSPLTYDEEVVGAEVEVDDSRIYVSIGHKISLETSIKIVRGMTAEGLLPEPLRRAHKEANRMRGDRPRI
jgi:deoxyribonuclease V